MTSVGGGEVHLPVNGAKEPPDKTAQGASEASETFTTAPSSPAATPASTPPSGAVPSLTAPGLGTYSSAAAGSGSESNEIVDIINIVLKKTKQGVSYYLGHKEKANLVFFLLKIPRAAVVGIDQSDHRTIQVYCREKADRWRVSHSIQIKEGLITLPMRMFKRLTNVRVQWAGVKTSDEEIIEMLRKFGTFQQDPPPVKKCTYYETADEDKLDIQERMMLGLENGDKEVQMFINKHIPSYALLPKGRKVRVWYNIQPATCSRCGQGIRGCKGKANAAKCQAAGGKQIPLIEQWKLVTAEAEAEASEAEQASTINSIRMEGTNINANEEGIMTMLSPGLKRTLDKEQMQRSEDGKAWTITGLAPVEIRDILEQVSGTQHAGRTIFVTPILFETPIDPPPNEQSGDPSQVDRSSDAQEKEDGDDEKESDSEMESDDQEPGETASEWEIQEHQKRKAERQRKRAEREKEKAAGKEFVKPPPPPPPSNNKGGRSRQVKRSPEGSPEGGVATRSKRSKSRNKSHSPPAQ